MRKGQGASSLGGCSYFFNNRLIHDFVIMKSQGVDSGIAIVIGTRDVAEVPFALMEIEINRIGDIDHPFMTGHVKGVGDIGRIGERRNA